ncbi:MAG: hypothetical protein OXI22_20640 [Defluviicoccus sp.]|nr:hypothetical protein [Defluviicoccus sp.]
MTKEIIGKGDNIGIRLASIAFPDHRTAIVTFELFAFPSTNGGQHWPLVLLPQEVDCSVNADGTYDHTTIVREAGAKLRTDFTRVLETLNCRL